MINKAHNMTMKSGSRVIVRRNGFKSGGCVLGIANVKPHGEYYDIILDEPLNEDPSSREQNIASHFKVAANCIVSINLNDNGRKFDVFPITNFDINTTPECSLLLCPCGSIQPRGCMFICQHNHRHCWKHIIPWDERQRVPNVDIVQPLVQYILSEFPQATYVSTRALLYYSRWSKVTSSRERFNIALESLQEEFALCPTCKEDVRIATIRQLLFQVPKSLGSADDEPGCSDMNTDTSMVESGIPEDSETRPLAASSELYAALSTVSANMDVLVTDLDRFVFVDRANISSALQTSNSIDNDDSEVDRWRTSSSRSMSESVCALPISRSFSSSIARDSVLQQLVKTVSLQRGWSFFEVQRALLMAVFGTESPQVSDLDVHQSADYVIYRVESEIDAVSSQHHQQHSPATDGEITIENDLFHWHCQIFVDPCCGEAHARMSYLSARSSRSGEMDGGDSSSRGAKYESNDVTSGTLLAGELRADHVLSIRGPRDNLGPPCRMTLLASSFNTSLAMKTKELAVKYRGWRKIRGDGNCYYRAAAVGFIENAITSQLSVHSDRTKRINSVDFDTHNEDMLNKLAKAKRRESFCHLLCVLREVGKHFRFIHEQEAHRRLIQYIERARDEEIWMSPSEFEADIVNAYTRLDQSLVRALRQAVSLYLRSHQDDDVNGISLKDAILPSYPDMRSMDMYCEEWVDRMGVDAEGPMVDMGVLFSPILRCSSTIVFLDRREDVNISELSNVHTNKSADHADSTTRAESQPPNNSEDDGLEIKGKATKSSARVPKANFPIGDELGEIHILLRPGHFDLLYPRYNNKYISRTSAISTDSNPVEVPLEGVAVSTSESDNGGGITSSSEHIDEDDGVDVIMPVVLVSDGVSEEEYIDTCVDNIQASADIDLAKCVQTEIGTMGRFNDSSLPDLGTTIEHEKTWWVVACAYPRIVNTVYGIAVLSADNARASSGNQDVDRPSTNMCSQFSDDDGFSSPVSTWAPSSDEINAKVKVDKTAMGSDSSSEFVLIMNTGTEESLFNGGWEDVDVETKSAVKSPSRNATRDFIRSYGSIFTALEIPKTVQDCWDANDSNWRVIEWFSKTDIGNVAQGIGLQDGQRTLRVFNVDRDLSLSGPDGLSKAIDAIAIVEGTAMCRIAIRGIACLDRASTITTSPYETGYPLPLCFEVVPLGDWIGDESADAMGGGHAQGIMGSDVCVLTDMKQFSEETIDCSENSGTLAWCTALTATLGLDDEVYTIVTDDDVIAQYNNNEHHIQDFRSGLEYQVVTSGEIAVISHVVVCGRSDVYLHRPRHVKLMIPLSAFSSMQMLTSYLLRELHLHPLLALQICVKDSNAAHLKRGMTGGSDDSSDVVLRVLREVSEVLAWCTARYTSSMMANSSLRNTGSVLTQGDREPYFSLYIKYCEAAVGGTACETIFGLVKTEEDSEGQEAVVHQQKQMMHECRADDIKQISQCGHLVCQVCLTRHLVLYSNDRKFEEEYESWESTLTTDPSIILTHIFETPRSLASRLESFQSHYGSVSQFPGVDSEEVGVGDGRQTMEELLQSGLPILRRIPCPVPLCTCHVSEEDLSTLPPYVDAYSVALMTLDAQRSYRTCCLQEVMDCDPVPISLSSMVCLGCSHFYHPACFLHMVKAELDGAINKGTQIACYMCRVNSRRCDCPECLNRQDLPLSGAHVINQSDIDTARLLLGQMYKTDSIANRSGHPHLAPSKVQSLVKRWSEIHASVSVAAVVRSSSSSVMFECRCGSVYEVDKPSPIESQATSPTSSSITSASTKINARANEDSVGSPAVGGQSSLTSDEPFHTVDVTSSKSRGRGSVDSPGIRSPPPHLDTSSSSHGTFRCVNPKCGCIYCTQCMAEQHPGKSCHRASVDRSLEMMKSVSLESEHTTGGWLGLIGLTRKKQVGVNIQHCPHCDMAFGVPLHCHHATCETSLGGCGMEFCFICAAPREPILAHGNMFHRPSCPFNIDKFCCDQGCLSQGRTTCAELEYKAACPHCVEAGGPCAFPSDKAPPDRHWKILNRRAVEEEIRLQNEALF